MMERDRQGQHLHAYELVLACDLSLGFMTAGLEQCKQVRRPG